MSNITLTIPNDDSIALYHFGKSLLGMAAAIEGAPQWVIITEEEYDKLKQAATVTTGGIIRVEERIRAATETLQQSATNTMDEPEVDTTVQQVESLAVPMGDDESPEEFLQRYNESEPVHDEEQAPPTTDSTGTPWDERIHSTSKALNADGTWRLRRKPKDMDEAEWAALIESVKGELQYREQLKEETERSFDVEQQSINLNHVSIDPAHDKGDETVELTVEPPVTPPGDDFHTDAGVVTEQTVAGIPPLPVPPPPVVVAPPVPEVTEWDFPRLMTFLTERHGKIDVATVNTLLAQDDMSSVQELNAHPDKIGPFVARVKAHLGE